MKVYCTKLTSYEFDLKYVTTIFSNDFDYSFGGYGLDLGKEYLVMGVAQYKDSNCLYYLIDTYGKPNWYPYLLFDVLDDSIDVDWHFKHFGLSKDTDINFIFSFKQLCNLEFYDLILSRDRSALNIYFELKRTLELE